MLEHLANPRPKAALLGTYIGLYDAALPGHREKMAGFLHNVATALSAFCDVASCTMTTQLCQADAFVGEAARTGADALVVVSLGYTNSLTAADAIVRAPMPVVFFNTQMLDEVTSGYTYQDLCDNHGMQGVQDLAAVLVRRGRSFGMVTGLISQRETMDAMRCYLVAARAARQIHGSRIGSLTPPMEGMGDALVDPDKLKSAFGIEHLEISPSVLVEAARAATPQEVESCMAFDREHFAIAPELSRADHARSARLECGLRRIAINERLAGLVFSFDRIIASPGIETQPFLGISKLMAEGLGYGGEGDVLTAASAVIAQRLCDEVNFTEMYTMDFRNNGQVNTLRFERKVRL